MPASMICGIAPMINSKSDSMSAGSASSKIGIASRMPCASAFISSSAAFKMSGKLSSSICAIFVMTDTIVGTSFGNAFVIPVTSVSTTWIAVSKSFGKLLRIPSAKAMTSCNAPSAICGSADTNASMMTNKSSDTESTIIGRLSTIALPIEVTIVTMSSRSIGTCSITTSIIFGMMSAMTSAIFERSPPAAFIPLVNSPSSPTPSLASSVSTGSSTCPRAFFAAVAPTDKYWS